MLRLTLENKGKGPKVVDARGSEIIMPLMEEPDQSVTTQLDHGILPSLTRRGSESALGRASAVGGRLIGNVRRPSCSDFSRIAGGVSNIVFSSRTSSQVPPPGTS